MSQYTFKSNKYEFLTGWDRPLKYHFLVILDLETQDTVWSNLELQNPAMAIEEIEAVVSKYGAILPDDIRDSLESDET